MGTVITEITPLSDKDCFYLIDRFYDHEYGGVYWSVAADGTPADTHKQFYALGFAIYGLAEYVAAVGTGDERGRRALDYAVRLFGDIEAHSRDRVNGGYIEASWLLLESAMALGDPDLIEVTREHCEAIAMAALEGLQPDGSMIYERHADGSLDTERHWWVQAEMLIGQLYLWKYHGRSDMLGRAMETWKYIDSHIVDHEGGEWFWSCDGVTGAPGRGNDKAGFWKCPYHNTRMCLETLAIV